MAGIRQKTTRVYNFLRTVSAKIKDMKLTKTQIKKSFINGLIQDLYDTTGTIPTVSEVYEEVINSGTGIVVTEDEIAREL